MVVVVVVVGQKWWHNCVIDVGGDDCGVEATTVGVVVVDCNGGEDGGVCFDGDGGGDNNYECSGCDLVF